MVFIKILQRKDAASVIIAIALGIALAQLLSTISLGLSSFFSLAINREAETVAQLYDWRASLFDPAILLVLQVAALEVFLRIITAFRQLAIKMKHKS